jgi:uncharacterized protein (DUF58 family)
VDCSASTLFGTEKYLKSELITEITAVLAFSAISNNDKVGLLLFSDEIEKYIPPRKGKKTAMRVLREILYHQPQSKKTNINTAVKYLYTLLNKRSIIFLISDFYTKDYEDDLKILAKKHDAIAIQIIDSKETELPKVGLINLIDPETGQTYTVNTLNSNTRALFAKKISAEQEDLHEKFKKIKVDLITLKTSDDYVKALLRFFKRRTGGKRR